MSEVPTNKSIPTAVRIKRAIGPFGLGCVLIVLGIVTIKQTAPTPAHSLLELGIPLLGVGAIMISLAAWRFWSTVNYACLIPSHVSATMLGMSALQFWSPTSDPQQGSAIGGILFGVAAILIAYLAVDELRRQKADAI